VYAAMNSGWAEVMQYERNQVNLFNEELLFKYANTQNYYDLKGRIPSEGLIEDWFNQLLNHVSSKLAKHLI
jgi:hypothetical protein